MSNAKLDEVCWREGVLHCDCGGHARVCAAPARVGAHLLVRKQLEQAADTHGDD